MHWLSALQKNPRPIYAAMVVLLFPAVFYNLGLMPFITDEGIRASVALEMILSGDYLTPRLGGVYYLNKPPLYNWLIAGSFQLTGEYNELSMRLVMAISLLTFMLFMYLLLRKEVGTSLAVLTAFSFFTCGRVLTYDSLVGLIDICFSFFVFLQFYYIYHHGKRDAWGKMFLSAYAITVVTFLLKGLPAIAFVGISLIAYLIYRRKFRLLLSWQHIAAGLLCVGVVGVYYVLYFQRNPDRTLADVFLTLLGESSQRTAVQNSIGTTLKGLVMFPLEYIYAFLPFTVLMIYLFRKPTFRWLKENPFLWTMGLLFVANIILYWLSPKNHPRYLFMFVPLSSVILFYLHDRFKKEGSQLSSLIEHFFLVIMILLSIGTLSIPFLPQTAAFGYVWPGALLLFSGLAFTTWLYQKMPVHRMLLLILFLIIVRVGFNAFVLPVRFSTSDLEQRAQLFSKLGVMAKDKDLYIYGEEPRRYYHGEQLLNARAIFHITAERQKALKHKTQTKSGDWVIVREDVPFDLPADTVYTFPAQKWTYNVMEIK